MSVSLRQAAPMRQKAVRTRSCGGFPKIAAPDDGEAEGTERAPLRAKARDGREEDLKWARKKRTTSNTPLNHLPKQPTAS
jgi:hypothetical protein